MASWIRKAWFEWKKGKTVVMFINSITDTKAFHEYIYGQAELRFLKGRVKFINPAEPEKAQPSPKPSMVVIFSANHSKEQQKFGAGRFEVVSAGDIR